MPTNKNKFIIGAIFFSIAVVSSLIFVPAPYKMFVGLAMYLGLLFVSLSYQKTHKACMARIKELDHSRQFEKQVEYINAIKPLGYKGFVVDSYLLYAYYCLGDFKSYEETVLSIQQTKAWSRPKFEDFRNKVKDNLACIALLKHMADTGEVEYKGNNLMMLQAVSYYKDGNKEEVTNLLKEYPNIPMLKKVCMYVLSGQFEMVETMYKHEIARDLLKEIKEKSING